MARKAAPNHLGSVARQTLKVLEKKSGKQSDSRSNANERLKAFSPRCLVSLICRAIENNFVGSKTDSIITCLSTVYICVNRLQDD